MLKSKSAIAMDIPHDSLFNPAVYKQFEKDDTLGAGIWEAISVQKTISIKAIEELPGGEEKIDNFFNQHKDLNRATLTHLTSLQVEEINAFRVDVNLIDEKYRKEFFYDHPELKGAQYLSYQQVSEISVDMALDKAWENLGIRKRDFTGALLSNYVPFIKDFNMLRIV